MLLRMIMSGTLFDPIVIKSPPTNTFTIPSTNECFIPHDSHVISTDRQLRIFESTFQQFHFHATNTTHML